MKINSKVLLLASAIATFSASQSFGAGYATNSTSSSAFGNSYAGSVTGIHDASDVFFNPAVTAGKDKNQFIAGLTYIRLKIDTDNASGTFSDNSAVSGGDVADAGSNNFIPAFYLASPINDKATFNFAVTSPFGLATEYDENWAGRYTAVTSEISTVNFNPSIAYKLSDKLSVGAGVVAQYYKAIFTKKSLAAGDALVKMRGSDWGYGYNLGASYQLNDDLKFGIGYRSKIDHNNLGTVQIMGTGLSSKFGSETTTPESLTLGAAYQVNDKFDLAYDVTWTRWSRLQAMEVNAYDNSNLSETTQFNWKDSIMHSLGANYALSNRTLLRTGVAYEKDALTDANRGPRVPGGDRIWASIGFSQKLGNNGWSVDGAYMHQFYKSVKMNNTDSTATVPSLSARFKTKVDVLSIAIKKDF